MTSPPGNGEVAHDDEGFDWTKLFSLHLPAKRSQLLRDCPTCVHPSNQAQPGFLGLLPCGHWKKIAMFPVAYQSRPLTVGEVV
jgi:hypothetical protein